MKNVFQTFTSMVYHNEGLSAVEKMQYLKTHLTSKATEVGQPLDISNVNYGAAWKLLTKTFENKAIAWNHKPKFYNFAVTKKERNPGIKNSMDATVTFLANKKGIVINVGSRMQYIISQKLDIQSRAMEGSTGIKF